MARWSYSRFSTYKSCKNKYFLTYIKKLTVVGLKEELASKGLSFHEIAEKMNSNLSLEELMNIAKKDLEERDFDQSEFPILQTIPRLYQFWQNFIIPYENQGYKLIKESEEFGKIGDTDLIGYIDSLLINEQEKKAIILDFKTGKTPNTSSYKSQLLLYAYMIGKKLGITNFADNIKLYVFFPLASSSEEESSNSDLAKEMALKMIKRIIYTNEDVENNINDFDAILKEEKELDWEKQNITDLSNFSFACNWCPFAGNKQYCPLSYERGKRFLRSAKVLTREELSVWKTKQV